MASEVVERRSTVQCLNLQKETSGTLRPLSRYLKPAARGSSDLNLELDSNHFISIMQCISVSPIQPEDLYRAETSNPNISSETSLKQRLLIQLLWHFNPRIFHYNINTQLCKSLVDPASVCILVSIPSQRLCLKSRKNLSLFPISTFFLSFIPHDDLLSRIIKSRVLGIRSAATDHLRSDIPRRATRRSPHRLRLALLFGVPNRSPLMKHRESPMREGSRVELSLSGHGVTIGTVALAYLYDAACRGCERGGRGEATRQGRGGSAGEDGERQSECGCNGIYGGYPRGRREEAHEIRNTNHGRASQGGTKGSGEGRRATRKETEDSLSGPCLLPVHRVFAYPRHDQDPICIAPMKLLPCRPQFFSFRRKDSRLLRGVHLLRGACCTECREIATEKRGHLRENMGMIVEKKSVL